MNNQLSSTNRNKIASVVETAFKASLNGENPTQALAKAASEANLTMPQTLRACEALNVSSTLHHNKTAAVTAKTASFDIADPDMLSGIMFPSELPVKEASYDANNGSYDLGSYKLDFGELEIAEPEMAEDTADTIYKRSSEAILKGQSCLGSAEAQELEAIHGVDQQLEKIAGMVGGLYGDASASIEDEDIREYVNGLITKAASTKPAREPSTLLVEAVNHLKDMFKVAGECAQITAEVRQEVEGLKKLSADTRYMALGTKASPIRTKFGPIDASKFINPVMGALIYSGTQTEKARKQVLENFQYNPYDDEKFNDVVQTRSMLQNAVMLSQMIKEDDVLKNANPKHVVGAFNNIFSTTPQLAANPELTRAALRYSVEYGGMDYPTMITAMKNAEGIRSDRTVISELSASQGEKNKKQREIYESLIAEGDKAQQEREQEFKTTKKERLKEQARVKEKAVDRAYAEKAQRDAQSEKVKLDKQNLEEKRKYDAGIQAEKDRKQEEKETAKAQKDVDDYIAKQDADEAQDIADATERKMQEATDETARKRQEDADYIADEEAKLDQEAADKTEKYMKDEEKAKADAAEEARLAQEDADKDQDIIDNVTTSSTYGDIETAIADLKEVEIQKKRIRKMLEGTKIPDPGTPEYKKLKPLLDLL